MCAMRTGSPEGSQRLAAVSALLLGLVVAAGVLVGVYALSDPKDVRFGAPWPLASELVAAVLAGTLALGIHEQRRRMRRDLFAFEIAAALVALVMLGAVAFALSFNQL
jgi:NO-binding membrane sensor protein with MHYT domain